MKNFEVFGIPSFKKGSGIHIKEENRGKFTDYCGGEVTQKCIDKAKKSGNNILVKRATFAENARKWKHQQGGLIKKFQNPASTILKKPAIVLRDKKTNKDYTMRDDGYFYVDQVGEDGNPIELKVDLKGVYDLGDGILTSLVDTYTYDDMGFEDLRYEFVDLDEEKAKKEKAEKEKAEKEARRAELMRIDKENEYKAQSHEPEKVDHLANEVTPEEFLRGRGAILKNNMQDWANDLIGATNDADKVEITDEQVQNTLNAAINSMKTTPATVAGKFGRHWYPYTTTDNGTRLDLGFKSRMFGEDYNNSTFGINGLFTANGAESTFRPFPEMLDYFTTLKETNTLYIKDWVNFLNDPKRSNKRYIMYNLDTYFSPYFNITSAHERAHALQLNAAEYAIEKYFNNKTSEKDGNKTYSYLKDGIAWDDYLDSPNEVYARVKSVQAQGMDPKEKYSASQIKEWIKKTGVTGLSDRYTDEDLEFLFNNVAYQTPTFNYLFPGFNSQTPTMTPVGYRSKFGNSNVAFVKRGNKLIHKPNGHRSILDNDWIPTKELKKKHKLVSYNKGGGTAKNDIDEKIKKVQIMHFLQQHQNNDTSDLIKYDAYRSNNIENYILNNDYPDIALDTYLFSPEDRHNAFINQGWIKLENPDYGLVSKGVGDRNLPMYQKNKDEADRKDLFVLGNESSNFQINDKDLYHAGYAPSVYYGNNKGEIYYKKYDLHDYGQDEQKNRGARYGFLRNKFVNYLDKIGNPTVLSTGIIKINPDELDYSALSDKTAASIFNYLYKKDYSSVKKEYNQFLYNTGYSSEEYPFVDYINNIMNLNDEE